MYIIVYTFENKLINLNYAENRLQAEAYYYKNIGQIFTYLTLIPLDESKGIILKFRKEYKK